MSPEPRRARRVVVTGLGAVTPCGNDVASTWEAMVAGRSGIARITRFDVTGAASQIGGEVKGLDAAALLGRREIRRLGLFMQYAMIASDEAVRDAGFSREKGPWPEADRFGVYVGFRLRRHPRD